MRHLLHPPPNYVRPAPCEGRHLVCREGAFAFAMMIAKIAKIAFRHGVGPADHEELGTRDPRPVRRPGVKARGLTNVSAERTLSIAHRPGILVSAGPV
jgi:hypothetical protein